MTAEKYFEYCRYAYLANPKTFRRYDTFQKGLTGKKYYKRYADGRDGGLLSIDEKSESKFNDWYHSGSWSGTHPWEIYRGGNSTHINLAIAPFQNGWKILLDAFSTTRMTETCRIALALDQARLPFTFLHKESYAKRLQGEDWVGVVPKYRGIAYAWQEFPSEFGVSDCIHLDWIFEENPKKRRHLRNQLKHLIFWLPEKITAFVHK